MIAAIIGFFAVAALVGVLDRMIGSDRMRRHLLAAAVLLIGATVVFGFGYPLLVTGLPLPWYFQPRPSEAGDGYDGASSGASNLGPSSPLLVGFIAGVNTVGLDGKPSTTNPFATKADPTCVPMSPAGVPVITPAAGEKFERSGGSYVCDPNTVTERALAYRQFNDLPAGARVPVDAVTASASGLDPDISAQNALDQAPRVARARHLKEGAVLALVHRYVQGRQLGFLGEPAVNVLELDLTLGSMR